MFIFVHSLTAPPLCSIRTNDDIRFILLEVSLESNLRVKSEHLIRSLFIHINNLPIEIQQNLIS